MRAFALTDFGAAPEIIDIPLPEPADGEVRVRVRAASVNGFDLSVANSWLKDMKEHRPGAHVLATAASEQGRALVRDLGAAAIVDHTGDVPGAVRREHADVGPATPSVPDPRDEPTLKARVLPVLANLMFPGALRELRGMTQAVTDSGLDWTIARTRSPTFVGSPRRKAVAEDPGHGAARLPGRGSHRIVDGARRS